MKSKQAVRRNYEQIEKDFFETDEAAETATICLCFERPSEVFDVNCLSKTPIFNDDFDEWLRSVFEMIPSKYKIALEVTFEEMDGYTPARLQDIFLKNLLLSARTISQSIRTRDHIAIGLIVTGLISFVAMMLIGNLWVTESFWHEVFFYFLDIATTVLFWEAAGILLVETREHRVTVKAYRERFTSIRFQEAETHEP